jgi:hypothetical protein
MGVFGKVDGKDVWYDLLVGIGANTKTFKVSLVSSQQMRPEEFKKWERKQKDAGLPVFTKNMFEKKKKQATDLQSFVYTDEMVQEEVDKRFANLKKLPINVLRKKMLDVTTAINVLHEHRVEADDRKVSSLCVCFFQV